MKEYGVSAEAINYLFSATRANTQANLDALSSNVLGQGIDHFQAGKYDLAISAFKRAAALSPFSENSTKAYNFIGEAYIKQEKTEEAIKTYQEAIRIYPNRSEFHRALGDIYIQQEKHEEALKAFEAAVKFDGEDAEARYSLGQSYLQTGEIGKAREQFAKVVQLTPISAAGFYGLGQAARAERDFDEAISQLTKAIRVNRNFEIAYIELGKTYADMGDFQKVGDQLAMLKAKNSDKTFELESYMIQATQPRMILAQSPNGFSTASGPKTNVSSLDGPNSALDRASGKKLFSMSFTFSKDMDEASIINPFNWNISRATIQNNGGVYNGGLKPTNKEALILPKPAYVTYDSDKNTATVNFWVSQNADVNATIDPKHIVFKFVGVDAYGKAMDTSADEYSGFRGIA
jgi:Flp pilus assembly protein TadD